MRIFCAIAACLILWAPTFADDKLAAPASAEQPLSLVVMDPLAEPLSCPCVEGYAQRKYEKLAEYLSEKLGRPVHVTFAESFEKALAKDDCQTIDIAIGKDSVVRYDAAAHKLKVTPLARLTGQDGQTTQTGLIVVRSADPAQRLQDLRGYRILFGPQECDEKFTAARHALEAAGVEMPAIDAAETTQACSDGACKIIEWGDTQQAAAVISSYAAPLLEGCGTIKKGDLRVIGETDPVPFVTAFATYRIEPELRKELRQALLGVGSQPELKAALETLLGFTAIDDEYRALRKSARPARKESAKTRAAKATESPPDSKATSSWPGWRGPNRDGRAPLLPKSLPSRAAIVLAAADEPRGAWRHRGHRRIRPRR